MKNFNKNSHESFFVSEMYVYASHLNAASYIRNFLNFLQFKYTKYVSACQRS